MTKKQLLYQINALNYAINHLKYNDIFKLQSPTGSGKTFIIAQLIDKYLEDDFLNSNPTTFIFIAPSTGNLDHQGYEKITTYLKKDWVKGFDTEYVGTANNKNKKGYLTNIDYFERNKVYFFGWQMFKKGTKITNIDSEKNDIYRVINNTKDKGINVCLIIDEAHREVELSKDKADNTIKQNIINELNPFKQILVSATLEQVNQIADYTIDYEDVRSEAAIKQNVIISSQNESIKNIDTYDREEKLILSAIQKQSEIKKAYIKNKINLKPLILIQIPDNVVIDKEINSENELIKKIEKILEKNNYKKGFNYTIWLSNEKTIKDKSEITKNDSLIEILIFKAAIATGWDIPRANVLVRIRDAKTKSFNIQTLGRILRNPLFKYYNNELIDNAFVFTDDDQYKNYIKQEKIVIDEQDFFAVKRSNKAKNSTFSLKKILINITNYNEEDMFNYVSDLIIKNKRFEEFLEYEHPSNYLDSVQINAKDVVEANVSNINKEVDKHTQTKLSYNVQKITLFDLYIKYRTMTKSSMLIENILKSIEFKINSLGKTIKDFYYACIYHWNKTFKFDEENDWTLKEWIEFIKDKYLKNKIIFNYDEYVLPEEYKVSTRLYNPDREWDGINTFDAFLKINSLDSENETKLYEALRNKELENIHIFRNGISPQNDYYCNFSSFSPYITNFYCNLNTSKNLIFFQKWKVQIKSPTHSAKL